MTKYDKLPDSILLELVASGDVDAQEYMLLKYKPLVISEIRFLYLVGAETEDLAQEGMIGLFTAIRDYKKDMKASFHTFATTCVRNRIHAAISAANRQKHIPLNSAISIYYNENEDEDSMNEKEFMSDEEKSNPENIILRHERIAHMYEEMNMKLSSMEKMVTRLYLEGLSRREIADRLGKQKNPWIMHLTESIIN
ncbi:MAG: sigma-70 family RNA polymerase sigma factor [Eubacterium sp.]|nr:sigma-70 family RNA polymerase sigma factor [Eubacterium sp.]